MTEMSDVERLIEIEAIKRLKAKQSRAIDTKDWVTYEAVHAPEHVSDVDGGPPWIGAKANTERLAELHKALGVQSVHQANSPEIDLLSTTTAKGTWAMECYLYWKQGVEEHRIHAFGFYHETYEKRNGAWLFTSRRLEPTKVLTTPGAKFYVDRSTFAAG
jgi:hypothetical protein